MYLTVLELLYRIANSATHRKAENRGKLEQFEQNFENRILTIRPAFDVFALQKSRLRKLGTPISDFDLLIGCTAIANNLTLISRNTKEMSRIEGLQLENWIDEL